MEQRDKAIADANQGRAQDVQFGVLRLLGYLARCFCPGPKGCVAAVLGDPRVQTGPVEVEEPPNDDKPDDDDDTLSRILPNASRIVWSPSFLQH